MSAVAALAAALSALALAAGCRSQTAGGDRLATVPAVPAASPSRPVRRVRLVRVGRGVHGAVVLRPAPAPARPPAVLFLHGWGLTHVADYRRWLWHLAKRGNVVIFPRYQRDEHSNPGRARHDALAGLGAAFRRVAIDRRSFVVAGHSAGAAMAADYAAIAGQRGLPRPVAVFAVYPGRAILGYPAGIPPADYRRIAASTRLIVLAGARDAVVGQAPARGIVAAARRVPHRDRRYVLVRDPRVADHYAPTRSDPAARRAFWRRLDSLIARSRPTRR